MEKYHGILIDVSQKDKSIFNKLKILGQKEDHGWVFYRVEIDLNKINDIIKQLQENMVEKEFYFHFYKIDELIVVFKKKIFNVKTNKSTCDKVVEYGQSIGIPKEQLDFYPCKVEDEIY